MPQYSTRFALIVLTALPLASAHADDAAKTYMFTICETEATNSCDKCADKDPITLTLAVSPTTGVVIATHKLSSGPVSTSALPACKVADKGNWVCGGEMEATPSGRVYRTSSYSMTRGRFMYTPMNLQSSQAPAHRQCFFSDGLLGRKLESEVILP